MDTFDRYLEFVTPHLPPELMGAAALADIKRVAAHLPGPLAFGTHGFEVPLGRPEPEADFLVSASRALGGPALLAASGPESGWDPALLTALDAVWLEFDVRERPEGLPAPSLFFSPRRDARGDPARGLLSAPLRSTGGTARERPRLLPEAAGSALGRRSVCRPCPRGEPPMERSRNNRLLESERFGEEGLLVCLLSRSTSRPASRSTTTPSSAARSAPRR